MLNHMSNNIMLTFVFVMTKILDHWLSGPDMHNTSFGDEDQDRPKQPKKLGLPKVLPDLPSVSQLLARRRAANSSRCLSYKPFLSY